MKSRMDIKCLHITKEKNDNPMAKTQHDNEQRKCQANHRRRNSDGYKQRGMQMNAALRYHFSPIRESKINFHVLARMWNSGNSHFVRVWIWYNRFRSNCIISGKSQMYIPYDLTISDICILKKVLHICTRRPIQESSLQHL